MVISNFQPKPSANQSPVAEQFEWHVSRCWPKCQSIGHWPHHNLRDKKTSIEKGNTGAGWLEKQKMFQKQYRGLRREFEKNRAWNRLCHTVAPFKFHPNSTYSPHGFLQSVSAHWVLKVQQSTNPQASPHFTSHPVSLSLSTFSPRNDPSWSSVAPTQGVAPASQIAGGPAPSGHARRSPSRIAHDARESWLKTVPNLDFLAWLSIAFICLCVSIQSWSIWSICAWSFPHLESWRCKRPRPPLPRAPVYNLPPPNRRVLKQCQTTPSSTSSQDTNAEWLLMPSSFPPPVDHDHPNLHSMCAAKGHRHPSTWQDPSTMFPWFPWKQNETKVSKVSHRRSFGWWDSYKRVAHFAGHVGFPCYNVATHKAVTFWKA